MTEEALKVLTPRQFEIAVLLGKHRTHREIAAELGISICTVKQHILLAAHRLEITHRMSLGRYAFDHGWCA